MVLYLLVYLAVFAVTILLAAVFQRCYNRIRIDWFSTKKAKKANGVMYCFVGCVFLMPIIAMFSLRYGIGTDYFNYERIYEAVHGTSISEYWSLHSKGMDLFYIEPAYYLMNKILPSFRLLLWAMGILMFMLLLLAIRNYSTQIRFSFALFIFLTTQYIYAQNGMRFSVALCLILLGYIALGKNKTWQFIIMVLLASLFHQASLFCLAMLPLKRYKYKGANSIRNILLFVLILSFPLLIGFLFNIIGNFSAFERYFSTTQYSRSETMKIGWTWLLHIVPVILPLLIFCRKELFKKQDSNFFFRICIMEIPFRMLGLYNTWYTRFARCSQIAQVIFLPLVLARVTNKRKRMLLYAYYIVWFLFYFGYYAIVNDQCDSLPYAWIFSQ